jgi:transcriptional regulator with XRE-family HTH domain
MILPMTQEQSLEQAARRRLRSLRQARGWSLDDLAERTYISASTLSRLESGQRRIAIDHLVTLARVLGSTVEELVAANDDTEVVIRPSTDRSGSVTFWRLTRPDDTSGRTVVKMRIPEYEELPEARVHQGRDWFYVLVGIVHLRLGTRDIFVEAGNAASFDTMTPHSLGGHKGATEILSILDHHGERAHLNES